jgi:hypothetical protein
MASLPASGTHVWRPHASPIVLIREPKARSPTNPQLAVNQGTKSSFANKVRNFPNAADVCAPFFGSTKDRENHIINLQYHGAKFWSFCAKLTFSLEKSPSLKKTAETGKLQP